MNAMSFRRNSEKIRLWSDWLLAHRKELAATGLPHGLYEHEHSWFYFLGHGAFPGDAVTPEFDVSQLTQAESYRLLAFLRAYAQERISSAETVLVHSLKS